MFHIIAASSGYESSKILQKKKDFTVQNQLVVKHSMAFNSFQLQQKWELRAYITAA